MASPRSQRSHRSNDYEPVAWLGRFPLHVATLLGILHVTTLVATVVALSLEQGEALKSLVFASDTMWAQRAFWQVGTYAFVHLPEWPFLLEMAVLFVFGREVERFIGRRAFLGVYLGLLILPPLLLAPLAAWLPAHLAGSAYLHFGVFVAFTALYPTVEFFARIQARWIVIGCFGFMALQAMVAQNWADLLALCLTTSAACLFIQFFRGALRFPSLTRRKPPEPRKRRTPVRRRARPVPELSSVAEIHQLIDPLLDKIAQGGLASLTTRERGELERARAALLEKSR